ncbi:MAG: GIY-YIG nuclease family protein [Patescibacteria group bacterium]
MTEGIVILACPESYNKYMKKGGYTYIMANNRPTLYVGVTSNLIKRVYEHKNNLIPGFTTKYRCHKLVYYETFDEIMQAIVREKQIKDMNRDDKLKLIRKTNPTMKDLYYTILESAPTGLPQNDDQGVESSHTTGSESLLAQRLAQNLSHRHPPT